MNAVQSLPSSSSLGKKAENSEAPPLNLYNDAPTFELSLDEFEVYALKRLRVLRKLERLKMARAGPTADQLKLSFAKLLKEELSDPRVDLASHFILRLSYCQNEELRRWFLQHESALFQTRLKALSERQLVESVSSYAQLSPISSEEKRAVQGKLQMLDASGSDVAREAFYKVPFTQALDLVASRQVYVRAGYAYVAQSKVVSILVAKFRTDLSRSLAVMVSGGTHLSNRDPEASRIYPLLKNLHSCLVHSEPGADELGGLTGTTTLTASNVAKLAPNMPLCMRQLQAGLERDKKLKHWGRMQYGLFLKGAGLSMEEALLFFQRHFTAVTGEKFQKEYAYNIRHMHGREGKRTNYTPYSCTKIILGSAPSTGDHHGCPYKHYDNDHLAQLLQKLQIGNAQDRTAIMNLKRSNQFQLACQKHFEVMHPNAAEAGISLENVGNHPNAWFRASVAYHDKSHNPQPADSGPVPQHLQERQSPEMDDGSDD
jgi:DNA primase large subunit